MSLLDTINNYIINSNSNLYIYIESNNNNVDTYGSINLSQNRFNKIKNKCDILFNNGCIKYNEKIYKIKNMVCIKYESKKMVAFFNNQYFITRNNNLLYILTKDTYMDVETDFPIITDYDDIQNNIVYEYNINLCYKIYCIKNNNNNNNNIYAKFPANKIIKQEHIDTINQLFNE